MAFTAPQETAVVTVTKREVALMPERASLPSILPPAISSLPWVADRAARTGGCRPARPHFHRQQGHQDGGHGGEDGQALAQGSPTQRPKVKQRAAGIRTMASICNRLETGVGFS